MQIGKTLKMEGKSEKDYLIMFPSFDNKEKKKLYYYYYYYYYYY
jgi:hypothetical protein